MGGKWHEEVENGNWVRALWPYFLCGCGAIRRKIEECEVCEGGPVPPNSQIPGAEGRAGARWTLMGAEESSNDYKYVQWMEREWKRGSEEGKVLIVLVFWIYFERRIGRITELGRKTVPDAVMYDLKRRYGTVGRQAAELHEILFGKSYWSRLNEMGCGRTTTLIKAVGKERNAFVHGEKVGANPILVDELVDGFLEEHNAWVKIHNLCLKETREAVKH